MGKKSPFASLKTKYLSVEKVMNPTLNPMFLGMLADPALPLPHRVALLRDALNHAGPETEELVNKIFSAFAEGSKDALLEKKLQETESLLAHLQEGPRRAAIFLQRLPDAQSPPRVLVLLEDGATACTVLPDAELAKSLRRGDRVLLDGKGHALLGRAPMTGWTGDEAQFERRIDEQRVEVTVRGQERAVFFASQDLMDKLAAGQCAPGAMVVVNARLMFAFDMVPAPNGLAHFRFLDRGPVPRVTVADEIGAPPKVIGDVAEHVRLAFYHPEVLAQYKRRLCFTRLLCGPSGTGKTLAVQGIHRQLYEAMSERTGLPIAQLPPRVFHLRTSQVLSMWLGESDKNLDRFFDEVEQMAAEPFALPDGRQILLPVLVVIEEADGLARSRAISEDAVYSRILTVALRRLDPNRAGLSDRLVIVLVTTNEPQILDSAFARRAGSVEVFGRLTRASFRAVLEKQVRALPIAANNGHPPPDLRSELVNQLSAWLYSPNSPEPGLVELTFAGSTTPVVKHHRDFLTGALVERAVQQAALEACRAQIAGCATPGLTVEQLMRAVHEQVLSIVAQLRETNAAQYLDVPDSVRIAGVRRIPQPRHLPVEFQIPDHPSSI